jgi:periplasmic copper chaperone A
MLLAPKRTISKRVARRAFVVIAGAAGLLLLLPSAAFAHAELDPDKAAPGSVVDIALTMENEQPGSPTINAQLVFPEGTPLTVVKIEQVDGWTAKVDGGTLGGTPATGITWSRPANSPIDNPRLPFTIGPLPSTQGQLVFKVLQTYANGHIDRWIEESAPGAPEPERPAPILELTPGGPGSVPATTAPVTVAPTTSTTSTSAPSTTTTTAPAASESKSDDSNPWPIVIAIVVVLAALGGGAYYFLRRRRRRGTP